MNEFHEYSSEEIIEYANKQGGIWGRVNFRSFKVKQLLDVLEMNSKYNNTIKDDILDRFFKSEVGDELHLGHRHLQHPRMTWLSRLNGNEGDLIELMSEFNLDETPSGAVVVVGDGEYLEAWVCYGSGSIMLSTSYERVL